MSEPTTKQIAEERRELRQQHKVLAEAAHERGDIPEANYQYGWVDALAADDCPHDSLSGDEGPVSELGRMPVRWRCDACEAIVYDDVNPMRVDDKAILRAAACIWGEITDEFWSRATPEQQHRFRGIARATLIAAGVEPDQMYPSARVRAALAEAYDRSAPPMGWPGPNE